MRVAVLFEYPTLNGGERSMLAVFDALAATECEPIALAPRHGPLAEALQRRGVRHVPFEVRAADGTRLSRDRLCDDLIEAVRGINPALVHANSLSMGRLTGAVAERLDQPCSAHIRDILNLNRAVAADLNRNRLLLAVSQATRDHHVAQGIAPQRLRVVYNGVDCDEFAPRPADGTLRREFGIPDSALVVLNVGQIGLRKGQDVLAEAAAIVADSLPEAHYLLVGERNSSKAESVAFEQNVIARFAAAGLADRLHCLGYRHDVAQIYNAADLLVHTAHQEPLGRVLLEAAAAGLPIVATDVGGTSEILQNGVTARLVPDNDPHAIAAAITELGKDRKLRQHFASTARSSVIEKFSIEHAAGALWNTWKELSVRRAPAR